MKRPRPKKLGPGVEGRQPFWPHVRAVVPVVAGTWYNTGGIAAGYARGETLRSLARQYGLTVWQVENALRYELRPR